MYSVCQVLPAGCVACAACAYCSRVAGPCGGVFGSAGRCRYAGAAGGVAPGSNVCRFVIATVVGAHIARLVGRLVTAVVGGHLAGLVAAVVGSYVAGFVVTAIVGGYVTGFVSRFVVGLVSRSNVSVAVVGGRGGFYIVCINVTLVCRSLVVVAANVIVVYLADRSVEQVVSVVVIDREADHIGVVHYNRFVKVSVRQICSVLSAGEYPFELALTTVPEYSENVRSTYQAYEVVVIDLIHCIILSICEIELISHLVGEEERFCLCSFVAHCIRLYKTYGDCYNCNNKLFHGVRFLKV